MIFVIRLTGFYSTSILRQKSGNLDVSVERQLNSDVTLVQQSEVMIVMYRPHGFERLPSLTFNPGWCQTDSNHLL